MRSDKQSVLDYWLVDKTFRNENIRSAAVLNKKYNIRTPCVKLWAYVFSAENTSWCILILIIYQLNLHECVFMIVQ